MQQVSHVQGTEENVISSQAEAEAVAKVSFPEKVLPRLCLNMNELPWHLRREKAHRHDK